MATTPYGSPETADFQDSSEGVLATMTYQPSSNHLPMCSRTQEISLRKSFHSTLKSGKHLRLSPACGFGIPLQDDHFRYSYNIYHDIFGLTCPNRYEHLMFFDPLVISEIIKKSRIFSRKNKKIKNKKRYF